MENDAMAMNPIQFQPGLSMPEFFERYGIEAQCAAALEQTRWPNGFRCPRCEGTAGTCQPHIDSHLIINMLFGIPPRSVWGS